MTYAYPIGLILGGLLLGLGIGFIAAAGNRSTLRFAVKEGGYIFAAGVVILVMVYLLVRP